MKEFFKIYNLFFSGRFLKLKLVCLYLVVPFVLGFFVWLSGIEPSGTLYCIMYMLFIQLELFIGVSHMAGIEQKGSRYFVFLRNTNGGREFLKTGLYGDLLRRIFEMVSPLIWYAILYTDNNEGISFPVALVGAAFGYLLMEAGIFLTRLFDNMTANILCMGVVALIGTTFGMAVNSLFMYGTGAVIGTILVSLVLGVAVTVFRIRFTLKRFDGGFYDA